MESRPIENPELVELLQNYISSPNAGIEQKVMEQLGKVNLLAPFLNDTSGIAGARKNKIHLVNFRDSNGKLYLPAFTDWKQIAKWRQDNVKALVMTIRDYEYILKESKDLYGIVINPLGENIVFTRAFINSNN